MEVFGRKALEHGLDTRRLETFPCQLLAQESHGIEPPVENLKQPPRYLLPLRPGAQFQQQ
jgi:hypothetical protein